MSSQLECSASPADGPGDALPLVRYLPLRGAAPSRAAAARQIKVGRVVVNGGVCTDLAALISPGDIVECDGAAVSPACAAALHVLLHKPAGYLSGTRATRLDANGEKYDDPRPSAYELLDGDTQNRHCMAVGRLDYDTTGLLLFTTDGKLSRALLDPESNVPKIYVATLRTSSPLDEGAIRQLAAGVALTKKSRRVVCGAAANVSARRGPHRGAAVEGATVEGAAVELAVTGGAYHQVKHMFALVGRPLLALHRRSFAGVDLEDLPEGHSRRLNPDEVARLYAAADAAAENRPAHSTPEPTASPTTPTTSSGPERPQLES